MTLLLLIDEYPLRSFSRDFKVLKHCAPHTPPEWANLQFSRPEKWYTTYCQGPLGVPKNTFGQIWELNFQEKITFYWFEERYQTKSFGSPKIWTQGSILTYLKKKFVQIGHVWTVSDNNFLLFFENGSHFWTAITLQLVDRFGQIFFLNRSEFYPESKYYVSCKVWFGVFSQINKRWFSPENSTLRWGQKHFWVLLVVPDKM